MLALLKNAAFLASLLIVAAVAGCVPRVENEVVIYAAADREYAKPILDSFERDWSKESVSVMRQFDVEASKTLGLVKRIESESERPRCDVFWNNEIMHTIRLQKQGLLEKRRWSIPDNWPRNYRAADGTWVGIAARARVLLVNRDLVPPEQVPTSVFELGSQRWKSKCGIAFPLYGTTATHMALIASHEKAIRLTEAALAHGNNEQGTFEWSRWSRAVASNAVVLSGNKQVALAVSSGELAWGLTDTDDAIIEVERGQRVEIVYPDQMAGGWGTVFIPNTICVPKKSPHPILAGRLADYLVSQGVESRLTMSDSAHFPIWPTAKEQSRAMGKSPIRWADVDFERAAEIWPSMIDDVTKTFGK
jgi:iron(III) transport system substrate-binding protein